MNGNGVRATLDGRKTQTRRPVVGVDRVDKFIRMDNDRAIFDSLPPISDAFESIGDPRMFISRRNPLGIPGDLLYIREAWRQRGAGGNLDGSGTYALVEYRASFRERWGHDGEIIMEYADKRCYPPSGVDISKSDHRRWRPSIHMPKWAARLWVCNTGVRVERIRDITEDDVLADGVRQVWDFDEDIDYFETDAGRSTCPFEAYAYLWDSIYAKRGLEWDSNCWVFVTSYEVTER